MTAGGVEFIDPSLITETEGFLVAETVFEGLIVPAVQSGLPSQPGVATRWEVSDDGLTYTFHLREDAKWSNGRTVTADDFVYAWTRKLHPDTASVSAEELHHIKNAAAFNEGKLKDPSLLGLKAPDARTLVVTLERPTPFFLNQVQTAHFSPVPKEAIEQHGKSWTRPENIISNGAYRLTEWVQRSHMLFEKNPHYWDRDNVAIPKVIFYTVNSEHQALTRYDTGQVHWVRQSPPPARIPKLIEARRPDFFIDPYLCFYHYVFRVDKPPFDDVRFAPCDQCSDRQATTCRARCTRAANAGRRARSAAFRDDVELPEAQGRPI